MDPRPFAIRLDSVGQLFWPFDARPVAERAVTDDVRWALLDEWERVRKARPRSLTLSAPAAERESTDEDEVRAALRSSLRSASGPLRRVDPLSRQDRIAAWIGILVFFLSVAASTAIDRAGDDVVTDSLSQGVLVVGWVALWLPAQRVVVQVLPQLRGKQPKLSPMQEAHLVELYRAGEHPSANSKSSSASPARRYTAPSGALATAPLIPRPPLAPDSRQNPPVQAARRRVIRSASLSGRRFAGHPPHFLPQAEPRAPVWVLADPHVGRPANGPSSPAGWRGPRVGVDSCLS